MPWIFGSTIPIFAAPAVGIAAAAILYALHHLRSHPRAKTVATLIFWREVSRQNKKRALFSFPPANLWTLLLLIGITTLLSFVLIADRWKNDSSKTAVPVFVFDIGSSMENRLSGIVNQAQQDISRFSTTPALITAGEQPMLLCQPGEPSAILARQLAHLQTIGNASASVLALNLAGNVVNDDAGLINWYTDQSAVPAGVATAIVNRIRIIHNPSPVDTVAITGAVFDTTEASYQGTLRVTVEGQSNHAVSVFADGKEAAVSLVGGQSTVAFSDIAANGQVIDLRLHNAPGPPSEHEAKFQIPRRMPLQFYFVGPVPFSLRAALLAGGSESTTPAGCIAVGNQDQLFPNDAAAFIKVVRGKVDRAADQPIVEANDQPLLAGLSLEGAVIHQASQLPVKQPLLLAGGSAVAGLSDETCYLSSKLLDDDADLPKKAAFPILIQRIARQLNGWSEIPPVLTALRCAIDPLWNNAPGSDRSTNVVYSRPIISSDLQTQTQSKFLRSSPMLPWVQILLALGLALLTLEGFLIGFKKII